MTTLYVGGIFLPGGRYGTGGKAVLRHSDGVVRQADEVFTFLDWGDDAADGARAARGGRNGAGREAEEIRTTGSPGTCSFSWDTPVTTAEGLVPISTLAIGDLVLAYHEGLGVTGYYPVTATWSHLDPVLVTITLDGEAIETTPEHPFYVLLRGWVPAEDVRPGDAVRRADGSYGRV